MSLQQFPALRALEKFNLISVNGDEPKQFTVFNDLETAKKELVSGGYSWNAWQFVTAVSCDNHWILLNQILDCKKLGENKYTFHALGRNTLIEFS
jgi:hypothetical protein